MANKLDELIGKSVKNNPAKTFVENSLADQLVKNADRALGISEADDNIRKGSAVKNLTFTFGVHEVESINEQVERFLKQGKNVSKSELMRIGLKLIETSKDNELADLVTLIVKHPRGRQS